MTYSAGSAVPTFLPLFVGGTAIRGERVVCEFTRLRNKRVSLSIRPRQPFGDDLRIRTAAGSDAEVKPKPPLFPPFASDSIALPRHVPQARAVLCHYRRSRLCQGTRIPVLACSAIAQRPRGIDGIPC